jgi:two-component system, cell cycle response regulator DivK
MIQPSINKELEQLLKPGILNSKKIIIAEDDATNYILMKEFLEFSKATIFWAKTGKETIDIINATNSIDLVLMDIQMPVMNGIEALKKIKETYPSIPVIAITAYAITGDREKGLKEGFDEYLAKPVSRKTLVENIMKFIV